jgi:hypothetical protein
MLAFEEHPNQEHGILVFVWLAARESIRVVVCDLYFVEEGVVVEKRWDSLVSFDKTLHFFHLDYGLSFPYIEHP